MDSGMSEVLRLSHIGYRIGWWSIYICEGKLHSSQLLAREGQRPSNTDDSLPNSPRDTRVWSHPGLMCEREIVEVIPRQLWKELVVSL